MRQTNQDERSGRSFIVHQAGTVSIVAALVLPVLLGFVALVGEMGRGLIIKTENQRVADLAAYAAAIAYASTNSTTTMSAVAENVAALNGIAASAVATSLVQSPRTGTSKAVLVKIATTNVLLIAPVIQFGSSVPVSSSAYAELGGSATACVVALSGSGTAMQLNGGASISAPACSVASNSTISVPCGTTITAKAALYNSTAPSQGCSGITGSLSKAATADPLSANAGVVAAASRAAGLSSLSNPAAPTVSAGTSIDFGWSSTSTLAQVSTAKCSGTFSGSTYTVTCAAGATYNFGDVTVAGGITVRFLASGTGATTYNFSGAINNAGTALSFGNGTFNVAKGIVNGGGATTSFGSGVFNLGKSPLDCNSTKQNFSICNVGAALTFDGPSTFVTNAGIYNNGGSTLTMGNGSTNSFNIGKAQNSYAAYLGGGSITRFGDATASSNLFQFVGDVYIDGGSCTTFGAASQHDFAGSLTAAGGLTLGAGVYSFYGYIGIGSNNGGDVNCSGKTVGVSGTDVTLATAGKSTISGGKCDSKSFCIGAGYGTVSLSAPQSASSIYYNLVLVGPTAGSTKSGAMITDGASNTLFAGAVYYPNGSLMLDGNAVFGPKSGQCLQTVSSTVVLSGNARGSFSNCFGSSSTGNTAVLVQ